MKRDSIFKAAAVVSSVTLFAGYVLYRSGAVSLPASTAQTQTRPTSGPEFTKEFLIMAGSKSAAVKLDPAPATRPAPASGPPRVLLPGSKSNTHITGGQSVIFGDGHVDWTGAASSTAPSTQPRILLPGSKSFLPAP